MQQRGRKGAQALAIASTVVEAVQRPDAPYDLTDEQTAEWWAIVNRMPADWFPRETHASLAQYCRHIVSARHVAQLITQVEKAEHFDEERYGRLLAWQERESRAIAALARGMRISQQSAYDKTKKRGTVQVERPWD